MSEMQILDRTGDTKLEWNQENEAEVANARETYDRLVTRGHHRAFRLDSSGGKAQRMDAFDPRAQSMILVPHVAGG